jgi:hypothetical protein
MEVEAWVEKTFAEETIAVEAAQFDSARTAEAIHARAETVTPLLEKILTCRPPPHWGLNE